MKILKPEFEPQRFFRRVSEAAKRALLLDYDGTLAPFTVERDRATPYPGVREILQTLVDAESTRVILITGRWTKDLIPLLGLKRLPEIWGSHGWEQLRPDGTYEIGKLEETSLKALAEADAWIERAGLAERVEHKPACLAVHWRGLEAGEVKTIRNEVQKKWTLSAWNEELDLHEFDGGVELRIPGRNKGFAVDMVFAEMGGDTAAAYLGDDLTDEDAFGAIKGRGLGVLVRDEFRSTAADLWITPPEELLEFLSNWAEACEIDK